MLRVRLAAAALTTVGLTALTITGAAAPAAALPAGQPPAPASIAPGSSVLTVTKIENGLADGNACTIGFVGQRPDGSRVGIYAGHCGKTGQQVSADGVVIGEVLASSAPELTPERTFVNPKSADWAYFSVDPSTTRLRTGGTERPRTVAHARLGDPVCADGAKSGWRCGTVTSVADHYISTTIPAHVGDSGGALIRRTDKAALGIASRSTSVDGGASTGSVYYDLASALNTAGLALVVG